NAGLFQQAGSFLNRLGQFADQAAKAGDLTGALDFLQQQAQAIKAVGEAAVQGVTQWAATANQAERDRAAADIAAVQATGKARQDALRLEASAVQQQIAAAQQWASAVQSSKQFVLGLQL